MLPHKSIVCLIFKCPFCNNDFPEIITVNSNAKSIKCPICNKNLNVDKPVIIKFIFDKDVMTIDEIHYDKHNAKNYSPNIDKAKKVLLQYGWTAQTVNQVLKFTPDNLTLSETIKFAISKIRKQ